MSYQHVRIEIEAPVVGTWSSYDLGVPRSPIYREIDQIDLAGKIVINGVEYEDEALREMFGKQGYDALCEIIAEAAGENANWEE